MIQFRFIIILIVSLLVSCANKKEAEVVMASTHELKLDNSKVKFIDQFILPSDLTIDSTKVGGLSSLDFAQDQHWYIISDDRAE